jgi:hypothetical protein
MKKKPETLEQAAEKAKRAAWTRRNATQRGWSTRAPKFGLDANLSMRFSLDSGRRSA